MKALLVYSLILSTSFTSFVVYAADFQTAPPTQAGPGNPDLPSIVVQSDADPGRDVLARAASASLLEERLALFDNYLEDPSKECPIVRDLFADLDESEVPTLLGTLLNSMDEDWITTRSKFVADLTQFVLDHGLLGPALSHIAQQPSRFHESNLFDDDTTATKDDAYHQARIALFMLQNSPPEVVLDPGIANLFRDVILNSRMHEDADYRLIIVKALQNLNTDSVIEFMKVFLSNESGERRRITEDDHSLIEDLCRDLSDPGQWCLRAVSISNKFPLERWLRTHQSKIMEFITEHGLDEFLSIVSISESSDISSCDFEDAIRSHYNGYVLSQQGLVQDSTDPAAF